MVEQLSQRIIQETAELEALAEQDNGDGIFIEVDEENGRHFYGRI